MAIRVADSDQGGRGVIWDKGLGYQSMYRV